MQNLPLAPTSGSTWLVPQANYSRSRVWTPHETSSILGDPDLRIGVVDKTIGKEIRLGDQRQVFVLSRGHQILLGTLHASTAREQKFRLPWLQELEDLQRQQSGHIVFGALFGENRQFPVSLAFRQSWVSNGIQTSTEMYLGTNAASPVTDENRYHLDDVSEYKPLLVNQFITAGGLIFRP